MDIKTATLGTEYQELVGSERQMLIHAATQGLRQRAGYVPGVDGSPLPEPVQDLGTVIPMADNRATVLELLAKWCEGRAWLAGSAALWRYELSRLEQGDATPVVGWICADYDLFAMSDDAYLQLKDDLQRIGTLRASSQSNCVFDGVNLRPDEKYWRLPKSVNLIRPIPGQDWEHPANLLNNFDLSVSQVALGAGWFYVLWPHHIEKKEMAYTGHGRNPMRLLQRALKYEQRGYRTDRFFWYEVLNDERVADAARLMQALELVRRKDNSHFESMLLAATDAVESDGTEYGGGSGDDDDSDDWY